VVGIDRQDVKAEALAVAAGDGAAPEAVRLAPGTPLDAPLDLVTLVLLLAMQAEDQRRDVRRAEYIGVRIEGIVVHFELPEALYTCRKITAPGCGASAFSCTAGGTIASYPASSILPA